MADGLLTKFLIFCSMFVKSTKQERRNMHPNERERESERKREHDIVSVCVLVTIHKYKLNVFLEKYMAWNIYYLSYSKSRHDIYKSELHVDRNIHVHSFIM